MLDSGAWKHMTSDKSIILPGSFTPSSSPIYVQLGEEDSKVNINGTAIENKDY